MCDVGGIVVHTAKGALVEHNYVNGFNMRQAGYNAGIWAWNSDDDFSHHNEVTCGHGTLDSTAYDIDCGNTMSAYGVVSVVCTRPPVPIPTRRPGRTLPEAPRVLPVRVSRGRARHRVGAAVAARQLRRRRVT
ncbi:hypothetical protein [Streptomyces sp. 900116325]